MVAYNFKQQFAPSILSGAKRQTIRALRVGRSRHARLGDDLQLYTGMQTKYCALIGRAICSSADLILLDFVDTKVWIDQPGGVTTIWPLGVDEFARSDGFADWEEMRSFWKKEHPRFQVFEGILIRWACFRPSPAHPKFTGAENSDVLSSAT